MEGDSSSTPVASPASAFLRVPQEIRDLIYGQLIPTPELYYVAHTDLKRFPEEINQTLITALRMENTCHDIRAELRDHRIKRKIAVVTSFEAFHMFLNYSSIDRVLQARETRYIGPGAARTLVLYLTFAELLMAIGRYHASGCLIKCEGPVLDCYCPSCYRGHYPELVEEIGEIQGLVRLGVVQPSAVEIRQRIDGTGLDNATTLQRTYACIRRLAQEAATKVNRVLTVRILENGLWESVIEEFQVCPALAPGCWC